MGSRHWQQGILGRPLSPLLLSAYRWVLSQADLFALHLETHLTLLGKSDIYSLPIWKSQERTLVSQDGLVIITGAAQVKCPHWGHLLNGKGWSSGESQPWK